MEHSNSVIRKRRVLAQQNMVTALCLACMVFTVSWSVFAAVAEGRKPAVVAEVDKNTSSKAEESSAVEEPSSEEESSEDSASSDDAPIAGAVAAGSATVLGIALAAVRRLGLKKRKTE